MDAFDFETTIVSMGGAAAVTFDEDTHFFHVFAAFPSFRTQSMSLKIQDAIDITLADVVKHHEGNIHIMPEN